METTTRLRKKSAPTDLNGAYSTESAEGPRNTFQLDSSDESDDNLVYSKKVFLTCRSPTDSFFLCQTLQNVYNETKEIRIRWYTFVDEHQDEHKIDENTRFKESYDDRIEIETVLTGIESVNRHPDKTITLKKQDILETCRLLKRSIKQPSTVRKRRRTVDVDEVEQEQPKKKPKARLFKVQSNRFLKENQTVTEYQVDPFFESK